MKFTSGLTGAVVVAMALVAAPGSAAQPEASWRSAVTFTDAHRQAVEFIAYDESIVLRPEQRRVMDDGLSSIPAPCCAEYSIATCCCPCNLARAVWGLSKLLIARHGCDAQQVKAAVTEWLRFTNPGGYTGDACFTGGCSRAFDKNGCGGMDAKHVLR